MYIYLIVFFTGLIIGSFLNVCIYRIPLEQSIVSPSSHCFHCKTPLSLWDLIPVFSLIFLKGKCRYCKTKISPRYLVVEILTGIIFLLLFLKFGLSIEYFFYLVLLCILICVTFIDYDYKIIPDEFILLGFGYGLIYRLIMYVFMKESIDTINILLGFLIGGGFFLLIAIVSNGGMGGGDIKLMAMLGFLLGWKKIVLISFLSFAIGSIFSMGLLLTKIKTRKDSIPFGPFISLSTAIAIFHYEDIIYWYLNFIYSM